MFASSEKKSGDKKASILCVIREYSKQHGYAPSYREIGVGVGLKSTSSVHRYIQELLYEGRLETDLDRVNPRAYRISKKTRRR